MFDTYGNEFGTLHFDMAGNGTDDTLNLSFIGLATDGLDQGTIHVLDAETVNIATNCTIGITTISHSIRRLDQHACRSSPPMRSRRYSIWMWHVLLHYRANTGWDFTVEGTDIGKVTRLDASGVTGTGAVGAVKAIAQASEGVTFIGGFGDDEFTGGDGYDTLAGGGSATTSSTAAPAPTGPCLPDWGEYNIKVDDGVYTVAGGDGTDTLANFEKLRFQDRTVTFGASDSVSDFDGDGTDEFSGTTAPPARSVSGS